ncbi:MAG: PAS domain S-box protein [Methanobacterium sp.]|uniref:PAS domain S-box protein n=1 Tax=Methanobacterium sp. TaxID=2164 RepID=UPI003D6587BB|nr:PAS domain S-box protein [Methanobacterium sp.]
MTEEKILLVEDEGIEAIDIKGTLESFGYQVPYVASRGEEAVEKALEIMPDLILMDITLKGDLNGIETVSKLKDLNIPVIYLTAHSDDVTVQKAKLTEPYGYLIKPYDPLELKFAIELALYKSNQEKKLKESEENFKALAENANEGIIIATGEGIHVYANQMAAEITGYTIEELLKTSMADLAHHEEINKHMGRYESFIKGETISPTSETSLVRKEGDVIPVEFTAAKTVWKGQPAVIALFRDISKRKKDEKEFQRAVEKELQESEELNYLTLSNISDAVFITDSEGKFIFICPNVDVIFGYSFLEVEKMGNISKLFGEGELFKPAELGRLGEIQNIEHDIIDKAGETHNLLVNIKNVSIKGGKHLYTCRDITKRKNAEDALKKYYVELEHHVEERTAELNETNRELQAISKCNQAMLRAVDEETLLKDVCSIICDEAGYRLAWVGYAEQDDAKTIRPVAWAGYDSGYIENAKLSWSEDTEHGRGPAGMVIRSGELVYVQDFKTDSLMTPWRENALQRGYRSGIALPLKDKKGKTFGVLLIYSAKPNAVNPDEIKLMKELSEDLAFGINTLGEQKALRNAEGSLRHERELLSQITETSPVGITMVNQEGQVIFANRQAEEVLGLKKDEITRRMYNAPEWYITDYDGNPFPDEELPFSRVMFTGKPVYGVQHAIKLDEDMLYLSINGAPIFNHEGKIDSVVLTIEDITQRKDTEEKLKTSEERMRLTLEVTQIGLWDWNVKNDEWYTSPTYYSMMGYEPRSGPGDRAEWLERVHPEDRARVKEKIDNVLIQNFNSYEYEARMRHADGTYRWVSVAGFSIERDRHGNATRILGIRMDINDRKQAEEALRESEEKYRTIFEESFDGLFVTSPEGKILDMNKKGIEMFGYDTKEEILRLDLEKDVYANPEDRKRILAMVNKERSAEYEIVVKKKNGDTMITKCSLTAVKDEDGVITSYRGIIRDITQQKKDEESIIKAKEEWENTFEAVPDLIAILDNNFKVVRTNKAMADRLGVDPEEAVGVTCYEVVHGLNEPPSFCPFRKLLEDGEEHTAEVHEDRLGGDFIVSVSPLHDSDGKLLGSVHVARDITGRKKMEEELQESEEFLRNIVENIPSMVFVKNAEDLSFKIVNKVGEIYFGHPGSELIGKNDYDFFPKNEADFFTQKDREVLQSNELLEIPEETIETKKLGSRLLHTKKIPLLDKEGNPQYLLGISEDITEFKLAIDALKRSLKEKDALLSEIHHRVKNNMQIISSLLNLQSQFVANDEIVDVLHESQNRIKVMANIHEKLYLSEDLNRINFSYYIPGILDGLFQSYSVKKGQIVPIFEVKNIMLNIETAVPCGLIISELISNSLKYAFPDERKGEIRVAIKAHGSKYDLIISDNGVGFPADVDFRNTNTLGLQLVNNLVEQIEGEITLDKSHGTEFKITFEELKYTKRI